MGTWRIRKAQRSRQSGRGWVSGKDRRKAKLARAMVKFVNVVSTYGQDIKKVHEETYDNIMKRAMDKHRHKNVPSFTASQFRREVMGPWVQLTTLPALHPYHLHSEAAVTLFGSDTAGDWLPCCYPRLAHSKSHSPLSHTWRKRLATLHKQNRQAHKSKDSYLLPGLEKEEHEEAAPALTDEPPALVEIKTEPVAARFAKKSKRQREDVEQKDEMND